MSEWIGGDFDPEELVLEEYSYLAKDAEEMEEEWDGHFE